MPMPARPPEKPRRASTSAIIVCVLAVVEAIVIGFVLLTY